MNEKHTKERVFYNRCGEILGIKHEYTIPFPKRTRWNTRKLGNGRYPGFGVIRCYGDSAMVISRNHGTKMFSNFDNVYEFLNNCITS